jgi:protein FAM32A
MGKTAFMGGSLSFKGDKKSKKKKKKSKHSLDDNTKKQRSIKEDTTTHNEDYDDDDDMTEAERKALKYKLEREKQECQKVAQKSHRERIEEFNEKLGNLTEHNDIPRVSAAGNG